MARPSKFTEGRIVAILHTLRGGATRTAAAAKAGIDRSTLYDWENADPKLTLPKDLTMPALEGEEEVTYPKGTPFPDALARAEGEAEAWLVNRIKKAGTESAKITYVYDRQGNLLREVHEYDWRAAAWLLDHSPRHRTNWLPKKGIEVSGPEGGPVPTEGKQTVVFKPDPEYLRQFVEGYHEVMAPDDEQEEPDPGQG